MEYSWEIYFLNTAPHENGLDNVVKEVNWRYQIKEDSYYTDIYLLTSLSHPPSESYIVFENLTDEIVFSWIQQIENIEDLQQKLQEKLNLVKNPVVVEKKIPWSYENKYTGDEEYLIVFDDQPNDPLKIWGPMVWNSARANNGLKERGVTNYEFPLDVTMYQKGILPINSPTVVNERVKIYRVEYSNLPELDNIFEYHEGLTWVTDSGKAVGTYFVLNYSVEDVKNTLKEKLLQNSFNKQAFGTTIELQNKTINLNTNLVARLSLLQSWQLMKEDESISCKLNTTDWFTLTKSEVEFVLFKIERYVSEVLVWEKNIFDQIQNVTTIEHLKQIEIQ